jgi:hypothetical protein
MRPMDDFNRLVISAANGLAMGVSPAEVAAELVEKVGEENAFLLFHAAKVYLELPEPPPPSETEPVLPEVP